MSMSSPTAPSRPLPAPSGRPVVVVLGSGRSGTSLLMQVLAALGVRLSPSMIEARQDNPQGFQEDAPIVKAQANLLRSLGAWPFHPLPPHWQNDPATERARAVLREILMDRLKSGGLWGFKDPRTSAFLPLWQDLFHEMGLVPKYILALRDPGSIVRSFMEAYDTPADMAEGVWLRRTWDALEHTQADCHIIHYEDWFTRSADMAAALAQHLGLALPAADTLQTIIRPGLDRSGRTPQAIQNPAVRTLHAALCTCRGSDFDRAALLAAVAACRPQ